MNYREMSNEALITMLMEDPGNSDVLETLTQRLRPVILGEALKYHAQLPYDTDDYLQEGRILIWKIALKRNYRSANFHNYFVSAIRFRYNNLYRDYVLKNYIRIGGYEDIRGNTYEILVEAEYAKTYREKHSEYCRRHYAKKKAAERERLGLPAPAPKVKLTEEELAARRRARSRAYYHAHADEINRKSRERKRIKQETVQAALNPCPV